MLPSDPGRRDGGRQGGRERERWGKQGWREEEGVGRERE